MHDLEWTWLLQALLSTIVGMIVLGSLRAAGRDDERRRSSRTIE